MAPPKWAPMNTAPRDGSLVMVRVRASEQGPAEVDAVRWAVSARSGEEGWVADDSDPFARVAYGEGELSGWSPLPTQLPTLRSARLAAGDPPPPAPDVPDEADEADGGGI